MVMVYPFFFPGFWLARILANAGATWGRMAPIGG
jgi:hypothetical protein